MTHRYSPLATNGHIHDKLFSSMISVFHGYSLLLCVFVKTRYQKKHVKSRAGSAAVHCSHHFILTLTNRKRYMKMPPLENAWDFVPF